MIESQNTTTLTGGETQLALCDLHRMNGARVTAANWREHIHWDRDTDLEEFAFGHDAGCELVAELTRTPSETMELLEALAAGPEQFVQRLQRTAYLETHVDPDVPLAGFIEYLFGGAGGGLNGPYARGFIAGFANVLLVSMPTSH